MFKKTTICLALIFSLGAAYAHSLDNNDSLFVKGKKLLAEAVNSWNQQNLMEAKSYFERLLNADPRKYLTEYYIGLSDNRIAIFFQSQNNKDMALKYIDDAITHLEKSIKLNGSFSESYALLSSVMGMKIGLKPILGMSLGMKSGVMMSNAMELEPDNPRVLLIAGQNAYYTPKMFGGGKNKAIKKLTLAAACFDSFKVQNPAYPDWGHEEVYAWLGLVNADLEEFEKAEAYYKKALEIKSDFNWVINVLMPELKKKMAKDK